NADLAVAAGADSMYGADAGKIAMQGAGLPVRGLQDFYVNTDYLLVDESDMQDVWRALVGARITMPEDVFDSGSMIQTRERRRVLGDHVMTYIDQIAGRTYPDCIVYSGSDYDSHGYPSHPYFALIPHDEKSLKANHPAPGGTCYTPYRCLLPRGFDRMLVVGLGISMERDAAAMVRMQRDISNQGYAAGVAAAMAAQENTTVRDIEVRVLQRHLVETGALPSKVLSHRDSFPLSSERVQQAVTNLAVASNPKMAGVPLAIVLSHRDTAIPMMRRAYHEGSRDAKLVYAKVLGMLGETTGVETLIEALRAVPVWDAKILQGAMAEYAHLPTRIDSLILALGFTKDPRALEPILEKLSMLDAETTLSHHRAVALALEHLGDDRAAKPLAGLLQKPGMRGHVMRELEPLHNRNREKRRREGPLREIVLARALFRCGDHHGLGEEILREYLNDIRGLFAVHAQAVLEKRR
ncbi:MAG: FAD-dependent oxidoreductase, partial [Candidatus Hydrogenedentota bacterium]